jgi:hypothetical protein
MPRVHPILTSSRRRGVGRAVRDALVGQAVVELVAETLERVPLLQEALSRRQQVVGGNAVRPRREHAVAAERREARDDADQDLLRRIAGVLRMPKHPQR